MDSIWPQVSATMLRAENSRHPTLPADFQSGAMTLLAETDATYDAFLKSRWQARSMLLGRYAIAGNLVLFLFDWVLTRWNPVAPALTAIVKIRLLWILLPLAGMGVVPFIPRGRLLPALVIALSLLWCWGNEWAYFSLGLAGTVIQTIAVIAFCVTAATFLPLRLAGLVAMFVAIAAGHVALDVYWPQTRPLGLRLWTDAGMLAFVSVELAFFRNLATSQNRGLASRKALERTLADLEASRRQAEEQLQERVQQALQEVKVLSGLLPICAWCHCVRDDSGYWERIEAYVSEHSEASFTHSICPDCAKKAFEGKADRHLP
jgi:hypothetical protein